jgi:hypothetical protein
MNHQFSLLHDVYTENQFISSDGYAQHAIHCEFCKYYKSDAIFRGRNWRGNSVTPLVKTPLGKKNLILGHSDQMTSLDTILFLRFLGYKYLSGINVDKFRNISIPIPIGVTNSTNESEYHRLFGNNELFMKANKVDFLAQSNGLVYGCFSTQTNPKERLPLAKLLLRSKHTFEEPEFSVNGRIRYLENLRKYAFTACPVGNGIDTHRLWEVLYMGGIPIIKKNRILETMLEELPFVLVQDWDQIKDEDFLKNSWERISNRPNYNFDKLKLDYWINLIHSR